MKTIFHISVLILCAGITAAGFYFLKGKEKERINRFEYSVEEYSHVRADLIKFKEDESLKSIGIDLISNGTLRQMITNLYSVWYDYVLSVEQFAIKHIAEIMNPSISEHLYTIDFLDRAYPLDVTAIKHSNSFRHNIKLNIMLMEYQLNSYERAKTLIENLIKEIENELGLDP